MAMDHYYGDSTKIRVSLSALVTPIQYAVDLPISLYNYASLFIHSQYSLIQNNSNLKKLALILKFKLQKMEALKQENIRLHALMQSSAQVDDQVLVAKLLQVDNDPYSHRVVLDKGQKHGVYVGQPVLDANGVAGQIVEVGLISSTALLITDISHALPVQNNRNGVRLVAMGTGNYDQLDLNFVTSTADLSEGDLIVTSGLGRRFPQGYPVGIIKSIQHVKGQPFARVSIRPSAKLNISRELLLVAPHSKNDNLEVDE